jgi:hypothetical protein
MDGGSSGRKGGRETESSSDLSTRRKRVLKRSASARKCEKTKGYNKTEINIGQVGEMLIATFNIILGGGSEKKIRDDGDGNHLANSFIN